MVRRAPGRHERHDPDSVIVTPLCRALDVALGSAWGLLGPSRVRLLTASHRCPRNARAGSRLRRHGREAQELHVARANSARMTGHGLSVEVPSPTRTFSTGRRRATRRTRCADEGHR